MTQDLLSRIVQNEQQFHRLETRHQQATIEKLLHSDFFEIGRSGKRYDRLQVIDSLLAETAEQNIESDQYALTETGSGTLRLEKSYIAHCAHRYGLTRVKTMIAGKCFFIREHRRWTELMRHSGLESLKASGHMAGSKCWNSPTAILVRIMYIMLNEI